MSNTSRGPIKPEEAMLISLLQSTPEDKRQMTLDRIVLDHKTLSQVARQIMSEMPGIKISV